MSFSFNWSGLNVPQITVNDPTQMAAKSGALFGAAARGADRMIADREYAGILRGNSESTARIAELKAELSRLQARNAEIRALMEGPKPVQPAVPNMQPQIPTTGPQGYPFTNQLG